ncbi:MAG: DUF433 domain-containing protein [Planctomycetota bacterium]
MTRRKVDHRRRARASEIASLIVIDERIRSGRPVVEGTRVPVETVLGRLAGGMSVREVADKHGVRAKDGHAAIAYAAEVVADERVFSMRR